MNVNILRRTLRHHGERIFCDPNYFQQISVSEDLKYVVFNLFSVSLILKYLNLKEHKKEENKF